MRRPEGTELSKAQSALATTVAPKTLPCRDAERQEVLKFVLDAVQCSERLSGPSDWGRCQDFTACLTTTPAGDMYATSRTADALVGVQRRVAKATASTSQACPEQAKQQQFWR